MNTSNTFLSLKKYSLLFVSFVIVAFGQPAWSSWLSIAASLFGFTLFWRVLLDMPEKWERFIVAMGWYASVQIVQLSWMISHPYGYIYAVLFFCAWMIGAQFGLLAIFITPRFLSHFFNLLVLSAVWVIFEWSRLFFLSGFSFNPVGLSLTASLYSLQFASFGGVYFLSFWVIFINLLFLKLWMIWRNDEKKRRPSSIIWVPMTLLLAIIPYIYGKLHLEFHHQQLSKQDQSVHVVLVQTAFPIEEQMNFATAAEARQFVMNEWTKILGLAQKHHGKVVDLIALPEYVVPYGTFLYVFPLDEVKEIFLKLFGESISERFPPLSAPYATLINTDKGSKWLVSNAFFSQTLANIFQADVVLGLEDSRYLGNKKNESYSAAFHFLPNNKEPKRYEKRVLVPMGEYIPFSFLRELAGKYGVSGSFTPGKEAKVFYGKVPFSTSICYEETYGNLIREGRDKGAELFVNLTSDVWYPDSKLPQQHFDHARLRTVESGVPLVRACNTGVTGAIDSLGRIVDLLHPDSMKSQWLADSLYTKVPTYHYSTLYSKWGNFFVVYLSLSFILIGIFYNKVIL